MSIKYSYETGMCKATHYNGLWPVKYEGTPGLYKKIEMVCSCMINATVRITVKCIRMHQRYIQWIKNG